MPQPTVRRAILLFAHGSSDPSWALPFERIRDAVMAAAPDRAVSLAYLERMSPDFNSAVAALVSQRVRVIEVVPLFLAPGGHVKVDLPTLARAASERHGIDITVGPAIGESPQMIAAIAGWAATR